MIKKYGIHITVIVLLALLALFLNQYKRGTTLGRRETNFAVASQEKIDEITICDNDGTVILTRENGYWTLNSRHEVREKGVEMLLQTLGRLRAAGPAPLSAGGELDEKFGKESTRIDIRTGRRVRTFLVYSEGRQSPTYILRQGSGRAFVAEVVGFSGHVASLFVTDENYWRTNILFNYQINDIAEILVCHKDSGEDSFILRQSPDREFSLYSYPEGVQRESPNDSLVIRYLANYFLVPFERYAEQGERKLIDSLVNAEPDHLIKVTGNDGSDTEVLFHKIIRGVQGGGSSPEFDLFRLHALIDNRSEMIVVPWHSVDLLLRSASYFYPENR